MQHPTRRDHPLAPRPSIAIVAAACLACAAWTTPARADVIERVMAVVEGRVILLSDVRAAIALGLETPADESSPIASVTRQLVRRALILAEVERYVPPAPAPAIVDDRLRLLRERLGSDEALDATLAEFGLDEAQLRERIRNDLRIETYLDQRFGSTARPTDEAVLQYYRDNRAQFVRPDRTAAPLSEVASEIRARLAAEQRQSLIREWIDELRGRASIVAPGLAPADQAAPDRNSS